MSDGLILWLPTCGFDIGAAAGHVATARNWIPRDWSHAWTFRSVRLCCRSKSMKG
jgi:hypothetical protein